MERRQLLLAGLLLGLLLAAPAAPALAQEGPPRDARPRGDAPHPGIQGERSRRGTVDMLLRHRERVGLSAAQVQRLAAIRAAALLEPALAGE